MGEDANFATVKGTNREAAQRPIHVVFLNTSTIPGSGCFPRGLSLQGQRPGAELMAKRGAQLTGMAELPDAGIYRLGWGKW